MSKIDNKFINIVAPLFGPGVKEGLKFYLSILKKSFDNKKGIVLDANEDDRLKNENYEYPDGPDNEINKTEWGNFRHSLEQHFSKIDIVGSDEYNNVLRLIKNATAYRSPFLIALIKSHIESIDSAIGPIENKSPEWYTAINFDTQKNLDNIFGVTSTGTDFKGFSYKLSKHVMRQLLEADVKQSTQTDSFWTTNNEGNNQYYRDAGDVEKLYTTDDNGNKIDVSLTKGTDALNEINNDRCMGTYVKEGTLKCSDYISNCIRDGNPDDISNCKSFMQDKDFWDISTDEVKKMNPILIKEVLNKFGFQIIVNDKLKEYESIGSWTKRLHEQVNTTTGSPLNQGEYDSIVKNSKLIEYFTMLIRKVNSNPAILNKNYNNKFNSNNYSNFFRRWSMFDIITPIPIHKRTFSEENILRQTHDLKNNLAIFRRNINNSTTIDIKTGRILINGIPYTLNLGVLTGGSNIEMTLNDNSPLKESYPVLKGMLLSLEDALKNKGKLFDSNTKKQIEDHLENFRKLEDKLIKSIKYVDKYIDLINIHKQYDPEDNLTIEHLQKFIQFRENYFDKTENKQDQLISAIENLALKLQENLNKK